MTCTRVTISNNNNGQASLNLSESLHSTEQSLLVMHSSVSTGGGAPKCCSHKLTAAVVPFKYLRIHSAFLVLVPIPHVTEHYKSKRLFEYC